MSSSRPHTSFTGAPPLVALAIATASSTKSDLGSPAGRSCRRRRADGCHLLGSRPSSFATAAGRRIWNCSPFQISHCRASSLHDAVHRLHRRVREEREFVGRFERFRGARERLLDVAFLPCGIAGLLRKLAILGEQIRRASSERVRFVPFDGERVASLLRRPEIRREHRHAGSHRRFERDDDFTPLIAFAFESSKLFTFAPYRGPCTTTAVSMPGRRTSCVNCAAPGTSGGGGRPHGAGRRSRCSSSPLRR